MTIKKILTRVGALWLTTTHLDNVELQRSTFSDFIRLQGHLGLPCRLARHQCLHREGLEIDNHPLGRSHLLRSCIGWDMERVYVSLSGQCNCSGKILASIQLFSRARYRKMLLSLESIHLNFRGLEEDLVSKYTVRADEARGLLPDAPCLS